MGRGGLQSHFHVKPNYSFEIDFGVLVELGCKNQLTNKIDDKPRDEKKMNVPNDADDDQTITDEDRKGASQYIKQQVTLPCLLDLVYLGPEKVRMKTS